MGTSTATAVTDDRFEVKRRLGAGAMGAVFQAYDRVRRHDVALKQLSKFDSQGILGFKREFRSLIDIVHPNLVTLYELHGTGSQWSFSMELIDGVNFLEYVRPFRHLRDEPTPSTLDTATLSICEAAHSGTSPTSAGSSDANVQHKSRAALIAARVEPIRLRSSLVQLVEGVTRIHRAGKLHRDLKPKNVLVDRHGRVVVCDFGLAVDRWDARDRNNEIKGTPAYMSPEQAEAKSLTQASDWYSVGAMLYVALTGRIPFESGDIRQLLHRKCTEDPVAPAHWDPAVDRELSDLCMQLLVRDPARRAGGDDVLATLGRATPAMPELRSDESVVRFFGREDEQNRLRRAAEDTRKGHCVSVFVSGTAGIGKTALVHSVLGEDQDLLVLSSRCHERESVPHKALDGLVDELTSYLSNLTDDEDEALKTAAQAPNVAALARLFPVIRRVPALTSPIAEGTVPSDPLQMRRAAFDGLRQLLAFVARDRRTAVFIDDLQWGDADSAPFFTDLMYRSDSPPVLFVMTYRSGDADTSPLLRRLLTTNDGRDNQADVRWLELRALSEDQARELAEAAGSTADDAARIVSESGGVPLFIVELSAAGEVSGTVSLDEILKQRVAGLGKEARAMLDIVALAGHPMPVTIVARAAHARQESTALAELRAARLVQTRRTTVEEVEVFHDRVRTAVRSELSDDDARRVHRHLARAFESVRPVDPAALAEHWLRAGDVPRAVRYADKAAAMAEGNAAFARAAYFYQIILDSNALDEDGQLATQCRLADAYANAGDLHAAAAHYLAAAERFGPGIRANELKRAALDAFLRGGQVNEGIPLAIALVRDYDLPAPGGRRGAIAAIIKARLALRARGWEFEPRREEDVPAEALRRCDMCWSLATGLAFIDTTVAAAYQQRFLLQALRLGEPRRVAMAMCLEIAFRAGRGARASRGLPDLIASTRELVERHQCGADVRGFFDGVCGVSAFLLGEYGEAYELLEAGERGMATNVPLFRWMLGLAQTFKLSSLLYRGEIRRAARALPTMVRDAVERGDLYLENGLSNGRATALWLVNDDADEALQRTDQFRQTIASHQSFAVFHFYEVQARTHIHLYRGEGKAAWETVDASWRKICATVLKATQNIRVEALFLRGRAAVAAAAAGAHPKKMLSTATWCARRLSGENATWASALAALIRACVFNLREDRKSALHELDRAVAACEQISMGLIGMICRRTRARLSGPDGAKALEGVERWMDEQGVARPERFARVYAPGFDAPEQAPS